MRNLLKLCGLLFVVTTFFCSASQAGEGKLEFREVKWITSMTEEMEEGEFSLEYIKRMQKVYTIDAICELGDAIFDWRMAIALKKLPSVIGEFKDKVTEISKGKFNVKFVSTSFMFYVNVIILYRYKYKDGSVTKWTVEVLNQGDLRPTMSVVSWSEWEEINDLLNRRIDLRKEALELEYEAGDE